MWSTPSGDMGLPAGPGIPRCLPQLSFSADSARLSHLRNEKQPEVRRRVIKQFTLFRWESSLSTPSHFPVPGRLLFFVYGPINSELIPAETVCVFSPPQLPRRRPGFRKPRLSPFWGQEPGFAYGSGREDVTATCFVTTRRRPAPATPPAPVPRYRRWNRRSPPGTRAPDGTGRHFPGG